MYHISVAMQIRTDTVLYMRGDCILFYAFLSVTCTLSSRVVQSYHVNLEIHVYTVSGSPRDIWPLSWMPSTRSKNTHVQLLFYDAI